MPGTQYENDGVQARIDRVTCTRCGVTSLAADVGDVSCAQCAFDNDGRTEQERANEFERLQELDLEFSPYEG